VTFVFRVTGDLVRISACSFTSNGSIIPAGDKIVDGGARFRDGDHGGNGLIETCHPDSLVVTFGGFDALPADGQVTALWGYRDRGGQRAGFRILRTDVRTHKTTALNTSLVPAQGFPLVSGFSYALRRHDGGQRPEVTCTRSRTGTWRARTRFTRAKKSSTNPARPSGQAPRACVTMPR